jgi:putative tryptophan/tyrosine transport system substrate-binding protein
MKFVLRRRKFFSLLGGAAAWPLAANAQRQTAKLPTIGYLGPTSPENKGRNTSAFLQRLRELGWSEDRTITIEHRWAQGNPERVAEIAVEFVRLQVNVIVTTSSNDSIAMKRATSVIPIVFAVSGDPVGTGLVASLARPGGNLTGMSIQQTDSAGKRIELLREVVPSLRRLAILTNPESPNAALELPEAQSAARARGLDVAILIIRRADDVVTVFDSLKNRSDALYVITDPLVSTHRIRINTLALGARLPTIYGFRELAESGGLMSYGPYFPALYRRTAEFVDKILRGTKPADIPVEQPTKFELVINLTTAKALGLTVPPTVLALTDEVIE